MKGFMVIFSLFLVGNTKGDILADYWKQGAASIGPIDLEPDLNGTALFQSLTKDLGTFMEEYETNIDGQFRQRIGYYGDKTYYGSVTLREAVSRADNSTPADAFDNFIIQHTSFLLEFVNEMKEYLGGNKVLGKFDTIKSRMQPRLNRGMGDFLLHLDRILITDFAVLSSYLEEMLLMGRQRVFEHYKELTAKYEISLPTVYSMMRGYLANAESYQDKLKLHTSGMVLMNFNMAKDEVLKMLPN